ncbi:MAG: hypothetical protein AAF719_10495 [Pseudomonadota bacterium]
MSVETASLFAGVSALAAAAAVAWNVWWSHRKSIQEAKVRVAAYKSERVARVRDNTCKFVACVNKITFQMSRYNQSSADLPESDSHTEILMRLKSEICVDLDRNDELENSAFEAVNAFNFSGEVDDIQQRLQLAADCLSGVLTRSNSEVSDLLGERRFAND